MAQYGRGRLRLVGHAEGKIGFGQAKQGFGHMAGGLIFLDDVAEPVDGGDVLAAGLIITADLHFLSGEVIAGQVDLEGGGTGINAVGKATDDVFQGFEGQLGHPLVADDIG